MREIEEKPNFHYSDSRKLRESTCQSCRRTYWVYTYTETVRDIARCCECEYPKQPFQETFETAKWLRVM